MTGTAVTKAPASTPTDSLSNTSARMYLTDQFISLVAEDSRSGKTPTLNDLENSILAAAEKICGVPADRFPVVSWDRDQVSAGNYSILTYSYDGTPIQLVILEWNNDAVTRVLRELIPTP